MNTNPLDRTPADLAAALHAGLLLDRACVGVRLFDSRAQFEAWPFPAPAAPLYYCAAVNSAAKGARLKLSANDICCDTAPRTLGLEPGFRDPEFVESYVTCGLYRNLEIAQRILADVTILEDVAGIALAPLEAFLAEEPPDVVIIPANPRAVMRVVQGAAFSGRRVRRESIGMHGICAESTAFPAISGDIGVSLLCSGTRFAAGWEDELMSVGVPWALVSELVEGLLATAERYET
ncbi:MAG TPA: DUF169 domain-containing protein, partial [Coriobacteriia bacterium]|nr:DUF169 domain-containing protein [Coriobacteriia bacterium]